MNSLPKILKRIQLNRRWYVTALQDKNNRVREWHVLRYGNLDEELIYKEDCKKPHIKEPSEVMIKVLAASVNPIDVAMIKGYGSNFLNLTRKCTNGTEFPLGMLRLLLMKWALYNFFVLNSGWTRFCWRSRTKGDECV